MKRNATQRKTSYKYTKVLDNRKHPIRGLWRRGRKFLARITVEDETGAKKIKWAALDAQTPAAAQEAMRALLVERTENRLRHIGRCPTFAEYLDKTYLPTLPGSGKRPATLTTEAAHYKRWRKALGHLRLDKIRASHIKAMINGMNATRSPRTCNIALTCLRHVLKAAKDDKFLKSLPTEDVKWLTVETKARRLYTLAEIEQVCQAALKASKNGKEFSEYLHFLAYSGAREQEALRVRWADVNFDLRQVTIGAAGDSKNHKPRKVDFNPSLEALLQAIHKERGQYSSWLFPSPQRGEKDIPASTLRETLLLARKELPENLQGFGFHDCRHYFISTAVMAGIDYMTIAAWVGHQDGGVLIGKVYGHLSDEHKQAQAARLNFIPVVLPSPTEQKTSLSV